MHKCLKWLTHVTKLYANDGQTELTRIWDKRRLTEEAVCVPQCVCKCVLVGDQMSHNKTKTQSKPKQSRAEQKWRQRQRQRQLTKQNAIMKSYSLLCLISFELYVVRKLRSLSVYLPLLSHYKTHTHSLCLSLCLSLALNLAFNSVWRSIDRGNSLLTVCVYTRSLSHSLSLFRCSLIYFGLRLSLTQAVNLLSEREC